MLQGSYPFEGQLSKLFGKAKFFLLLPQTHFFPLKYWQKIDLCLKDVLVFSEKKLSSYIHLCYLNETNFILRFFLFSDFPFLVEAEVMSMKTVLPTNQVLERSADLSMIWSEGL